jgi:hypothetical protein
MPEVFSFVLGLVVYAWKVVALAMRNFGNSLLEQYGWVAIVCLATFIIDNRPAKRRARTRKISEGGPMPEQVTERAPLNYKRTLTVALALFFLFVVAAPYQIYLEQQGEISAAQAQLNTATKQLKKKDELLADRGAKLVGAISGTFMGNDETADGDSTIAVIYGVITNSGEPTSVLGWRVTAVFPDGRKKAGELIILRENEVFAFDVLQPQGQPPEELVVRAQDTLITKANDPVIKGKAQFGYLPVAFPGENLQNIESARLIMEFSDVYGKEYSCEIDHRNSLDPPAYFRLQGQR